MKQGFELLQADYHRASGLWLVLSFTLSPAKHNSIFSKKNEERHPLSQKVCMQLCPCPATGKQRKHGEPPHQTVGKSRTLTETNRRIGPSRKDCIAPVDAAHGADLDGTFGVVAAGRDSLNVRRLFCRS
jgi:hypothetical protein